MCTEGQVDGEDLLGDGAVMAEVETRPFGVIILGHV